MKAIKAITLVMVLLTGALAAGAADAHGRARVGVFIGAPILFSPWYYYPPYPYYYHPAYYYPPTVVVPASPPVYVEQSPPAPAAAPQRADPYWYYCPEARAYYPYVRQCAGGWQRVVPQPPPPS